MSKSLLAFLLIAALWIVWCVLVVTIIVPQIRLRVTMWPWLMAYILCLLPVIAMAIVAVVRSQKAGSSS